jgi:hypothetical protein
MGRKRSDLKKEGDTKMVRKAPMTLKVYVGVSDTK